MHSDPQHKVLYLVDGTSQLYRAHFAIRGLSTASGLPTNAVYGFTSMLRKLLAEEEPRYIAVAFDLPGPVFRHERFADYKANRAPAPDDLAVQIPYAKEVCDVLGVPVVEQAGYEADDLIATYAARACEAGFETVIVASDKDLLQLVREGVTVLNPIHYERLDAARVVDGFGVRPEYVRDVLGLRGDSVDNIPGVPGVGEKTAIALVSAYGDLEAVIRRAACFVTAWDTRDLVLEALDHLARSERVDASTTAALAESLDSLSRCLVDLAGVETDPSLRERLQALGPLLSAARAEAPGSDEAGRAAARRFQTLKRELKGLDRGSSRRVWYAVAAHAEQARLSRELATLDPAAPIEFRPEQLERAAPALDRARELFERLEFRALVDDFTRESSGGPALREELVAAGEYEIVTDAARLHRFAGEAQAAGRLAVRTATDGAPPLRARWIGLALSDRPGRGIYVPIGHRYLGVPSQLAAETVRELVGPLLSDPGVAKTAHDVKAELHVLERHGLSVRGWVLDARVAAFLLDSSRLAYSVPRLAAEFLGYDTAPDNAAAGEAIDAETEDVERATRRLGEECDLTLRLAEVLEERLRQADLLELYREIDGPLLPLLAAMEARGIRIDVPWLEGMSRELAEALERARREILELAGGDFNVDSPKQLREVLFDRLGLAPQRKTAKSRAASTDAQTLETLAAEHVIAARILEYRELAKLKGTYVDTLPALVDPRSGRVHGTFHPTGAATGRLSSSDPNLQNIPTRTEAGRRVRAAFVPAPDHVFLASDYSQVELRVLAHMSGDTELVAAFLAGEDIHRHTAARVFGVASAQVTPLMRRRAKAVNFGIVYGMSETRLARDQGMTRPEAHRFIEAYFERFRGVRDYIDRTRESARRDAAVHTLFGRLRRFPQLHQRINRAVQEQALRAAVNTTIQGTAADLMKLAMLRVEAALAEAGLGARILLQVHDELLLEVPTAEVESTRERVREAMEGVHRLAVPLVADQKIGRNWLDVS